jgi:ABC-type glutathione transport system ATPase component
MDIESNTAQDRPIEKVYELVPKGESMALGSVARRSIVLEWNNVDYSIPIPGKSGEMKQILYSLNGAAYPGEILGILGTSGAGINHLELHFPILCHHI